MALNAINPRPTLSAPLNATTTASVGVGGSHPAFTQNGGNNGSIVLHSVDPGNANATTAVNAGYRTFDRSGVSITLDAGGNLNIGDAPVFNIAVFDIPNWVGLVPLNNNDGNPNGSVTFNNGNYHQRQGGVWTSIGGFPSGQFNAFFSSITFNVTAAGGGVTGGTALTRIDPTGVTAVLGQSLAHYVGPGTDGEAGTPDSPAWNLTGTLNGTLVLHAADSANAAAANGGNIFIGRSSNTVIYTPGGSIQSGSAPQYNLTIFDIPGWGGTRGVEPQDNDGEASGTVVYFNNNYYRNNGGIWEFLGGFPNTIFDAYFSTITFDILATAPLDPVAFDQSALVFRNTPKVIQLVAIDQDGAVIAHSVGNPTSGTLSGIAPAVTYTPPSGFLGPDSFTFFVTDDDGQTSNTATVTINVVNEPTEAPYSRDIDVSTNTGRPVNITLVASDPDGDSFSYQIDSGTLQGTLTGSAPNLVYTPPAGVTELVDVFYYTVRDNNNAFSNTSCVVIRVLRPNECRIGNMIFTSTDVVVGSELSSNLPTDTSLEFLKTSETAELLRVTSFDEPELVLRARFGVQELINYFAIPGSNLPVDAEIKIDLFERADDAAPSFISEWFMIDKHTSRNNNTFFQILNGGERIAAEMADVYIRHTYPAASDPGVISIPNGIPRQEANGILSIEAESAAVEDNEVFSWAVASESTASNGAFVELAADSQFDYGSYAQGPKIAFQFTPTINGVHRFWMRFTTSNSQNLSFFTNLEGSSFGPRVFSNNSLIGSGWQWASVRVENLSAGQIQRFLIAPRSAGMRFDKLVVLPDGMPSPNGLGPAESPQGATIISTGGEASAGNTVDLRKLMIGEFEQMDRNFAYGASIKPLTDADVATSTSGRVLRVGVQRLARRITVNYQSISSEDRRRLYELEYAHKGGEFIISGYPSDDREDWLRAQHTMLTMYTSNTYTHDSEGRFSTQDIVFREV